MSLPERLDNLLDMLGDAEFKVQPYDNRFEAVVTVYPDPNEPDDLQRTFRAVDRSARMALVKALTLSMS